MGGSIGVGCFTGEGGYTEVSMTLLGLNSMTWGYVSFFRCFFSVYKLVCSGPARG